MANQPFASTRPSHACRTAATLLVIGLLFAAPCAHAAAYRCTDAHGQVAYQDVPCAVGATQREIALVPQPAIGDADEVRAVRLRAPQRATRPRTRKPTGRAKPVVAATSWECRTADGEVFYRHTRCPASVPGDGVVRNTFVERTRGKPTRNRRGAWQRVPVHGRKVSRAEACQRIDAPAAAVRDGHLRDARVSTYDHLMGRDPCSID